MNDASANRKVIPVHKTKNSKKNRRQKPTIYEQKQNTI